MSATLIGVNTGLTKSAQTDGSTFALGDRHTDSAGNTWVYVKASAAFTLGDCVAVKSTYKGSPMTDALSKTCMEVAVASKVAFTLDDFGWIQTSGNFTNLRVAASCQNAVPLYITGTAGILDDATLSSMIQGLYVSGSATGAGAHAAFSDRAGPRVNWGASLSQI